MAYKYEVIATIIQPGRASAYVQIKKGNSQDKLREWVNYQLTSDGIRFVKDETFDVWYNIESIFIIEIRKATD